MLQYNIHPAPPWCSFILPSSPRPLLTYTSLSSLHPFASPPPPPTSAYQRAHSTSKACSTFVTACRGHDYNRRWPLFAHRSINFAKDRYPSQHIPRILSSELSKTKLIPFSLLFRPWCARNTPDYNFISLLHFLDCFFDGRYRLFYVCDQRNRNSCLLSFGSTAVGEEDPVCSSPRAAARRV